MGLSQPDPLSQEQLSEWNANGYLILERAFSQDDVRVFQKEADFVLELIINSSLCHQRHSRRLDMRRQTNGRMVVRKIQPINDLSLGLAKLCADKRVIAPLHQLMADQPVLMEEKLNYKQPIEPLELFQVPADEDSFPIHNDWAYYKFNGYPDTIISTAVSFDDCSNVNGTIHVFPGTHHNHIEHDRVRNGLEVRPGSVQPKESVPLDLPPGSICYFHSKLIHTSQANETDSPRRIMIFSHYPEAADMGIDVRNGPNRLRESPWEWEYQRRKHAGLYTDQFSVNSRS